MKEDSSRGGRCRDLGFAKLDLSRAERTGYGESVYCPGKTKEQLAEIFAAFHEAETPVLATKCSPEQAEFLRGKINGISFDPVAGILSSAWGKTHEHTGLIAVCSGGTADLPVAEEAALTAEFFGAEVSRYYDIGIAGLHRLLACLELIRKADVVITVAGMEGALGSVLAGLVETPVIAVPTSAGYGANFGGIAPLLAMLNSCAEGIAVVNIDNGFGGAMAACRILRMKHRRNS